MRVRQPRPRGWTVPNRADGHVDQARPFGPERPHAPAGLGSRTAGSLFPPIVRDGPGRMSCCRSEWVSSDLICQPVPNRSCMRFSPGMGTNVRRWPGPATGIVRTACRDVALRGWICSSGDIGNSSDRGHGLPRCSGLVRSSRAGTPDHAALGVRDSRIGGPELHPLAVVTSGQRHVLPGRRLRHIRRLVLPLDVAAGIDPSHMMAGRILPLRHARRVAPGGPRVDHGRADLTQRLVRTPCAEVQPPGIHPLLLRCHVGRPGCCDLLVRAGSLRGPQPGRS